MKYIISIILIISSLFGNNEFDRIKNKLEKKGIEKEYIKKVFELEEFNEIDEKTLNILHPKKIKKLQEYELKANENLIKKEKDLKNHLKEYEHVYKIAEKKYKVNKEIIAAILMKETKLGKIELKHTLISSLSTIYKKYDKKNERDIRLKSMAERSLIDIIEYSYKNKYGIEYLKKIKSSYAGAIGIVQFMPFNLKYAVSFNNEIPNLNKMEDAILSVGNFLNKQSKWNKLIDWNKSENIETLNKKWNKYKEDKGWISFANKKESFLKKEYIKEYALKLYTYNNSSEYVIGILRLAYKIKN